MTKSQKNEKLPGFVKIFGGILLAMIALVMLAPLFKEPTQEPKAGAHNRLVDTSSSRTSSNTDINRRFLLDVIRNHPRAEVSEGIWPRIAEGAIQLSFSTNPFADGHFKPMPLMDSEGRMVELRGQLSMSLHDVDLARRGDPKHSRYIPLVLLHESVHYEQILTGRFSPDVITSNDTSREGCMQGWQLEREAYYRECQFAMEIGNSSVIAKYCTTLDPQEFDRNLLRLLKEDYKNDCPEYWAEAIAHSGT